MAKDKNKYYTCVVDPAEDLSFFPPCSIYHVCARVSVYVIDIRAAKIMKTLGFDAIALKFFFRDESPATVTFV